MYGTAFYDLLNMHIMLKNYQQVQIYIYIYYIYILTIIQVALVYITQYIAQYIT